MHNAATPAEWYVGARIGYTRDVWVNDPSVLRLDDDIESLALVQGPAFVWYSDIHGAFTNENMYVVGNGEIDVFEADGARHAHVAFFTANAVGLPMAPLTFVPLPFLVTEDNTTTLAADIQSSATLAAMRSDRLSTAANSGVPVFVSDALANAPGVGVGAAKYSEATLTFYAEDGSSFQIQGVPVVLSERNNADYFRIERPYGIKYGFYIASPRAANSSLSRFTTVMLHNLHTGEKFAIDQVAINVNLAVRRTARSAQDARISTFIETNFARFSKRPATLLRPTKKLRGG